MRLIHQRLVLLFIAALPLLTACTASEPPAQSSTKPEFEWRLVTAWPKNFPGAGQGPEKLADLVSEMSNGRLKIRVFGAGEKVPSLDVFNAVSEGRVEMAHSASYYWHDNIPASPFFAAVPFGMTAQETNAWLYYGGGMALWEKAYRPYGVIPMAGGASGVQMGGWFNHQINSVDDLKGLRIRIPGSGAAVMKRLGAHPVNLPANEIFQALQSNQLDAAEWIGPYNDLALGLYQAGQYYYYPGWREPNTTFEFLVNQSAFEALPHDLQAILKTAARAVNQDVLDEYTARNNDALNILVHDYGVELRPFPKAVLEQLREASRQVVEAASKEDELSRQVYTSYMTFMNKVTRWHHISERAMLNARDSSPR